MAAERIGGFPEQQRRQDTRWFSPSRAYLRQALGSQTATRLLEHCVILQNMLVDRNYTARVPAHRSSYTFPDKGQVIPRILVISQADLDKRLSFYPVDIRTDQSHLYWPMHYEMATSGRDLNEMLHLGHEVRKRSPGDETNCFSPAMQAAIREQLERTGRVFI